MSRLDKQLDRLSGEKLIRVEWPEYEAVDLAELRRHLVQEIDEHSQRIPLDLRAVKGAPPELVDLLVEMRRYALSKGKILSWNWILPQLREALDARVARPVGSSVKPSADPDKKDTSAIARELLNHAEPRSEFDPQRAERIERKRMRRKRRAEAGGRRYLQLGILVLALFAVVAAVEYMILMQEDTVVIMPEKGFESSTP